MNFELDPSKRRNERPDWLPDWTDEASYTVSGDGAERIPMSDWGWLAWAWEFLRRNPAYWHDWSEFDALPDSVQDEDGRPVTSAKWSDTYTQDTPMRFFHGSQPVEWGETVEQYEQRTGDTPELLRVHLERRWAIARLCDPAQSRPAGFGLHPDITPPPHFGAGERLTDLLTRAFDFDFVQRLPRWAREQIERDDRIVYIFPEAGSEQQAVAFDLRYEIGPQVASAERTLKEFREALLASDAPFPIDAVGVKPSPAHQRILPRLLRSYDGVWTGASYEQVANVLHRPPRGPVPPTAPRKVGDEVGKAKILISDGFRRLLTLSAWG